MGVCLQRLETQPPSYGLAFAVGWCETAKALVGQMAFGRCFATFRHSYYSPDARRYRPRDGFGRWGIVGAGYIGLLLFVRFVSRRIERRQLEQNIEKCRDASRVVGTLT